MPRRLDNWLESFMEFTKGTEAPRLMHFWVAVSTVAGVLKRRVWLDMKRFKWYPNFYVLLVAPPGIISKTTTMDMGMDLLKRVPGVKFGPEVVTWPALVKLFAESGEMFQYGEDFYPMSALTLASGELGNLINPQDRDMINVFISLWDGRSSFDKVTKMSGNDSINAPWINMIGCTTPHWIADNMPQATIGGGFTSRCIFVYGEKKEHFVAYPDESAPPDINRLGDDLVADLEHMSVNLVGPFTLTEDARVWGREWYETLWTKGYKELEDDRLEGYLARKQTHMHKLSMVISAARGDSLTITRDHLQLANIMLTETEHDLGKVFSRIGRTEVSLNAERFLELIKRHGKIRYQVAYQHVHAHFPDFRDFEGILAGLLRSGQIRIDLSDSVDPTKGLIVYTGEKE